MRLGRANNMLPLSWGLGTNGRDSKRLAQKWPNNRNFSSLVLAQIFDIIKWRMKTPTNDSSGNCCTISGFIGTVTLKRLRKVQSMGVTQNRRDREKQIYYRMPSESSTNHKSITQSTNSSRR